jgi:hypothetical protein
VFGRQLGGDSLLVGAPDHSTYLAGIRALLR